MRTVSNAECTAHFAEQSQAFTGKHVVPVLHDDRLLEGAELRKVCLQVTIKEDLVRNLALALSQRQPHSDIMQEAPSMEIARLIDKVRLIHTVD